MSATASARASTACGARICVAAACVMPGEEVPSLLIGKCDQKWSGRRWRIWEQCCKMKNYIQNYLPPPSHFFNPLLISNYYISHFIHDASQGNGNSNHIQPQILHHTTAPPISNSTKLHCFLLKWQSKNGHQIDFCIVGGNLLKIFQNLDLKKHVFVVHSA